MARTVRSTRSGSGDSAQEGRQQQTQLRSADPHTPIRTPPNETWLLGDSHFARVLPVGAVSDFGSLNMAVGSLQQPRRWLVAGSKFGLPGFEYAYRL